MNSTNCSAQPNGVLQGSGLTLSQSGGGFAAGRLLTSSEGFSMGDKLHTTVTMAELLRKLYTRAVVEMQNDQAHPSGQAAYERQIKLLALRDFVAGVMHDKGVAGHATCETTAHAELARSGFREV